MRHDRVDGRRQKPPDHDATRPAEWPDWHEFRLLTAQARVRAEQKCRGLDEHRDGIPDPRNRRSCWDCGKTFYSGSGVRRCWACRHRRRKE